MFDILEEALSVFWRGVAFLEGTCHVLEGVAFFRGACSVLEGHDILEEVLGCVIFGEVIAVFGGVWHFWRGVAFLEGCLQCFGGG